MEREIRIIVKSPCDCTEEEYLEWVKFCLGYSGRMSADNPMVGHDLEAKDVSLY